MVATFYNASWRRNDFEFAGHFAIWDLKPDTLGALLELERNRFVVKGGAGWWKGKKESLRLSATMMR
jgi:hypothetical protein